MTSEAPYFGFDYSKALTTIENQRKCTAADIRHNEGITFIFADWSDKEPALIEVAGIPEGYYFKYGGAWRFKSNPDY
jgi:hypothetical protein